jgi:hypothetical protein
MPWWSYSTYGYGYAVCSVPLYFGYDTEDDAWYAFAALTISGSCFPPGEEVTITVCDEDWVLTQAETSDCGAFFGYFDINTYYGYWPVQSHMEWNGMGWDTVWEAEPVAVKAWINAEIDDGKVVDGELYANWPLFLYTDSIEPPPPGPL